MINTENNSIKSIHYLGSKLRMLDFIKETIDELDPSQGTVCDLFCGSAVVSKYLLQYRSVIAVDIQNYSKVLCEASINAVDSSLSVDTIIEDIKNLDSRKQNLADYSSLITYEDNCLVAAEHGNIVELYEIIELGSLYAMFNDIPYGDKEKSTAFQKILNITKTNVQRNGSSNSLDSIMTRYYGGLYFSYRQAIEIDAIASYAFNQNEPIKNKILGALIGTVTDVVNTVGKQFAQPLKVRNSKNQLKTNLTKKILADRSIDVYSCFEKWLNYYISLPTPKHEFISQCSDYVDFLKNLTPGTVSVIYADPPYTRYHYSRYYHVLETLCLRDNPSVSTVFPNGKGGISRAIYREGRHQSPFCIKTQAYSAFDKLCCYSSRTGAPLVISYSPYDSDSGATPRLLTIDEVKSIACTYYEDVQILSPGHFMHSRFNSADNNYEINYEAERLIVCKGIKESK